MKKRILEIIYGICLILKVYSIINFSELRNSIAPAFREVYGRKWIVGEAAFEIMSLLALWLLLGNAAYSNKKRGLIILGFLLLNIIYLF